MGVQLHNGTFVPARGLSGPNAQTLFAHLFRPRRAPSLERERWETPDGDFLHLDFLRAAPDAPHLVVLHGLEGSARSGYVLALLRGAAERGWGGVAVNFRSCSGEDNLTPRLYHLGATEDVAWVLERLRTRVEGPLLGAGFSLGGNVLLKLLGEQGEETSLTAAAAMSVPFSPEACVRAIDADAFWARLYRGRFLASLKRKGKRFVRRHPGAVDAARLLRVRTLREYDDLATAPLHGFDGATDYYERNASARFLERVRRPTLLLNAKDDPFVPADTLPRGLEASAYLTPCFTERGGHVGFVAGSVRRPAFWGDARMLEFLEARLTG